MARSYYSLVLEDSADAVWSVIRPFEHYAWAGVQSETVIEDGKRGDQVGAVRRVTVGARVLRQRLRAHSDLERSYSYEFAEAPPFPVCNYLATLRVTSVVETGGAFVEWWANFDCATDELDRWTTHFEQQGFAVWLAALREFMRARRAQEP